ncbi:hypothetical protein [Aquibacillus kalidii]|uniref:hypothetical protein n=1 Tax=Aquibacillus kalidii TaxID=2762597 RepID=UPI001648B310|nr:hypothetical protein [Aquibacillus kalidii]
MAYMKIELSDVLNCSSSIKQQVTKTNSLTNNVVSVKYGTDYSILKRNGIGSKLTTAKKSLQELEDKLQSLHKFMNHAVEKYQGADDYIKDLSLTYSNNFIEKYYALLKLDTKKFLAGKNSSLDFISKTLDSDVLMRINKDLKFRMKERDGKRFLELVGGTWEHPRDYTRYRDALVREYGGESGTYKKRFVNRLINGGGIPLYVRGRGIIEDNLMRFSGLENVQKHLRYIENPLESIKGTSHDFTKNLKVWEDFDWRNTTKLSKFGKSLGAVGTGFTVFDNYVESFYDAQTGQWNYRKPKEWRKFGVNVAVDVGMGAGAIAVGATAGSFIVPPIGTVVGAGIGAGLSFASNYKFGTPPKSVTDHTKDIVNKGIDEVSDFIGGVGKKLDKVFW